MARSSTALPLRKQAAGPVDAVRPLHADHPGVAPLPVWGGVECTHNRVGDTTFDQAELSGHARRPADFATIAALGIRTLRFGLLWERRELDPDWVWADASFHAMEQSGIRPIVGLLHHGSGPRSTSLLDQHFPIKLATYAGQVAERYPQVDAYTPVNEPNTTARFSGRYGLWYPHHCSAESFLRMLLNQVKGTALAMQAIRRVRPDAQLIQTDDAGSVTSTPELQAAADLLHVRQWLSFDLLCGLVDRLHPMFNYLREHGIREADILWFADHPCPPDVIGLNYYVTSDRFLDHRTHRYPQQLGSSEGPFVDVEAVRVRGARPIDFSHRIREAWQRYQSPVALTEVHLGGPPYEQIRWLAAAYRAMQQARHEGVRCAALTVWALLGSYYWNELVTRNNGHYEPGVFHMTDGQPVPTPLAAVVRQLAAGHSPSHGALDEPGWWLRPERFHFPWPEAGDAEQAA